MLNGCNSIVAGSSSIVCPGKKKEERQGTCFLCLFHWLETLPQLRKVQRLRLDFVCEKKKEKKKELHALLLVF